MTKTYEVRTELTATDIFSELVRKSELQKTGLFTTTNDVDYKSFKIINNKIEIDKWPSLFDPFNAYGKIVFEFRISGEETNIKCTVEPFTKYAMLCGGCLLIFVLLTFTFLVVYFARENVWKTFLFILFAWGIALIPPYWAFRLSRNGLEVYSMKILNDLGIKF
ncbi:MAG: hypothetical protein EOP00_15940 [Pedobacter sp.]|nr:MAG: hypothetical protein EOP00_15940 [Pedobacter sp.]